MTDADPTRTAASPIPDAQAITRTAGDDTRTSYYPAGEYEPGVAPPGFVYEKELGRGGMGVVFLARQAGLNRHAAVKMMLRGGDTDPRHTIRFLAEAEAVAAIHHTNVIQVYEFGEVAGRPFLAMEYLANGTLSERLKRGRMEPKAAAALVAKLADAVQAAHDLGIVHRDVKPGNILFDEHDEPKLTDFGLAKRGLGSDLTQTQAVMGTPAYMAPEQAAGRTKFVGPPADIYALGVILFECLCGKRPFDHPDTLVLLRKVAEDDAPSVRREAASVSRDLELVCEKCLAKEPTRRYASAGALAADLRRFLNGEPVSARPLPALASLARWTRKHPTTAAATGVGLAMLAVLLVGAWVANGHLRTALADAKDGWNTAEARREDVEKERAAVETQRELAEKRRQEAEVQKAAAVAQKTVAERNEAEATRLRVAVETQRAAETETLQSRLTVLDDLLFKWDDRLANYSGLESVRREFLDEVRKYSQNLLLEKPDDPTVMSQAARVHRRIGDVYESVSEAKLADAAYGKAIALLRKLTAKYPDKSEYLDELSLAVFLRGFALANTKPKDAAAAFAEATPMFDKLAPRADQPRAGLRAARSVFRQANALEAAGGRAAALPLYREAFERQEKLLKARPTDHELWNDLGSTALSLAMAVEPDDAAKAFDHQRASLAAYRKAATLAPQVPKYATNHKYAYAELAAFCERHRRDADYAAMAREYETDHPPTDMNGAYNAACFLALAAKTAAAGGAADRADAHAKDAVKYLQQAVERGFSDRVHLRNDFDLDPLRDRADFKEFLATVDKRFPNKSVAPAELVRSLKGLYDGMADRSVGLLDRTTTVAERKRAERERPSFDAHAKKVLAVADAHPGEAAGLDGLVWIVRTGGTLTDPIAKQHRATALAKLEAYVAKPEFVNACPTLSKSPSPAGDKLLAAAAAGAKDVEVRGLAALALGYSLAKQAETARPGSPAQLERGQAAEDQLEKVAKDFAAVPYQESTIGKLAKTKLDEVRTLSVGRAAREIVGVDLDGKPLKLSDHRGKVVLLDFWANWCGYCRQMYPHEKAMVEAYSGRPLVVLGVNGDDDLAVARRAVEKEKLNWRSWWDGGDSAGRIREEWQVDSYPRLFLIDHTGVIRQRWKGLPDQDEVDAAVERLVREAEKAAK